VMNDDAIGCQAGLVAGVGRMTATELSAIACSHVLYSHTEVVVFAAGVMFPHQPHERGSCAVGGIFPHQFVYLTGFYVHCIDSHTILSNIDCTRKYLT
jgi:hypothetical protein